MCQHLDDAQRRTAPAQPGSLGCRECLDTGGQWVQLRLCLACGHVGCCDSSPGRHATGHFHATRHPVIKAFEPGQDWAWCYVDGETAQRVRAFPAESPAVHYAPGGSSPHAPQGG